MRELHRNSRGFGKLSHLLIISILDILNQLKNLNYDFSNLFATISSSPYLHHRNHLLQENSLIYASFFSYFNEHYSVSYPNQFSYSIAHVQAENDFWLNRTLMINQANRQIEYLSMTPSEDVLSMLFNQSFLIPYRNRNEIYFLQNPANFQQIKAQLNQPVLRPFKVNLRSPTANQNSNEYPIDLDLVVQNSTSFHIRFGSTYDEEYQRLIGNNLSQMNRTVWERERAHLMDNARLYHLYTWSQHEMDELISNGYLANYTITYCYDPRLYPEIIDDPSNVRFQMKI